MIKFKSTTLADAQCVRTILAAAFLFALTSTCPIVLAEDLPAPDSPRQALIAQDAAAHAGDVQADRGLYQAGNDQQTQLVAAIAEGDIALAKLQEAVSGQFGEELGHAVVHVAGSEDAADARAASEKVDGDQATVEFKDHAQPLRMVRVDGKWKISLADMLSNSGPEQIDHLEKAITQFTAEIRNITELVEKHRFRSGEGVRDRIQELHDKLFGREEAPAAP